MKERKCLQCEKLEADCNCDGGFKIIYFCGAPKSKAEMDEIPTFDEAMKTARKEIKNIQKIFKELDL